MYMVDFTLVWVIAPKPYAANCVERSQKIMCVLLILTLVWVIEPTPCATYCVHLKNTMHTSRFTHCLGCLAYAYSFGLLMILLRILAVHMYDVNHCDTICRCNCVSIDL